MSNPWQNVTQFAYNLAEAQPSVDINGGGVIIEADQTSFPALDGLAIFLLTLEPGAVRIPHWHPDTNEMQYMLTGQCHFGLITPAQNGNAGLDRSYDLTPGMIGFIPQGWFHHIENTGSETATMLVIFNNANPNNVDISWGFQITPPTLLQQVFGISFQGMLTNQIWIAPGTDKQVGGTD